jgi:hypothetical protein
MEEKQEEEDASGIQVKKTSKKGLSKFLSQIFRRSAAPDNSIAKQATDDMWKQMWMRKEPDKDGYFLLQLEKQIGQNDMFLTAEDASSLTIARKLC